MKRSWIGCILLVLLLLGSLLSSEVMVRIHEPVAGALTSASRCAMEGDWTHAEAFFREAEDSWKQWEHLRSCFADHTPVEEIDGDFQLLKVLCASRETISFAGGSLQLARQVAAVGEAHAPVWWNLV